MLLVFTIATFDIQVQREGFEIVFIWSVLDHDNLVVTFFHVVELAAQDRWVVPLKCILCCLQLVPSSCGIKFHLEVKHNAINILVISYDVSAANQGYGAIIHHDGTLDLQAIDMMLFLIPFQ